MKKGYIIGASVLFILILSALSSIYLSNPIIINGISEYHKDGRKEIVLETINKGISSIRIQEVRVNGNNKPKRIYLGISYDTNQMVQYGLNDPLIQFVALDKEDIIPELTIDETLKAIKRKEKTPIKYGIRIEFCEEAIHNVTVKYKYFGFVIRKKIPLEKWNIDNN
jgi:hypothetical protein